MSRAEVTKDGAKICSETDEYIDVDVGVSEVCTLDGTPIGEFDYRVNGEVWRVNKYDQDPFPSSPHAHCIAGSSKFRGRKLHLWTAQLYSEKNKPIDRLLAHKQFFSLIEKIRPKFPDIEFPHPEKWRPRGRNQE